ncbi:MAG: hypothetical protein Q8P22_04830 [Chloroflexota bacterium]|nr:hypothetical protein [Chloroflexota bacterium]
MKVADRPRRAKADNPDRGRGRRRAVERPSPGRDDQKSPPEAGQDERGFLFKDPYWDEVFCSYYDPTLRTCCGR